jgi:hypothetical protein
MQKKRAKHEPLSVGNGSSNEINPSDTALWEKALIAISNDNMNL